MKRLMRWRYGFTMMELMMVSIVVAILAALAIPQYRRTVQRSQWNATMSILQTIYTGEQVYWTTEDVYKTVPIAGAWNKIWVDNPNTSSPMPVNTSP